VVSLSQVPQLAKFIEIHEIASGWEIKALSFFCHLFLFDVSHVSLLGLQVRSQFKYFVFIAGHHFSKLILIFSDELTLHEYITGELLIVFDDFEQWLFKISILSGQFFEDYLYGFGAVIDELLIDGSERAELSL